MLRNLKKRGVRWRFSACTSLTFTHSRNPLPLNYFTKLPSTQANTRAHNMVVEASMIAGVSITAAVAFRSLIDKVRRGGAVQAEAGTARVPRRRSTNSARIVKPIVLDAQDRSQVMGNMMLAAM